MYARKRASRIDAAFIEYLVYINELTPRLLRSNQASTFSLMSFKLH